MQICQNPSVMENNLPNPPQTVLSRQFCPTPQMAYGQQQKSFDQQSSRSDPHAFFQPTSRSADLQPNWTPQMWSSGPQNQLPYISPASGRNHLSNIVHHAAFKAGQVETLTVNLSCDPKVINTANQRNYKDLHSMQNVSCTSNAFVNSSCTYGSVPPGKHPINRWSTCYHGVHATHQPAAQSQKAFLTAQINHAELTTNMNQGQMRIVSETPNSVVHVPAVSSLPVNSLLPSQFVISSSHSQVQNPLCQPTPCRKYDGYGYIDLQHSSSNIPHLPKRARLNSATVSGLTANSQDISTFSTSTSHTSSPRSGSGSDNYSHGHLIHQLLRNHNNQISGLNSSSFGSQFAKSKSGSQQSTHDSTANCITTGLNYSQDKARQGKTYKEPVKETGISRGNAIGAVGHLAEPQRSRQNQSTNWKKRNEESCIYPVVCQNLVKSQLRIVHQVNKAVAVVPPISQQVFSHGPQNDVTTSTHFSLLLKTNIAKSPFEKHEKETNVQNMTFNVIEGLSQVPSLPSSSPRLGSAVDISIMPTTEKNPTSGSQSCENSQCENDPVSATENSNKCQGAAHIIDSTSKVSVEQSNVKELESSSEETTFDLSTVPVVEYTLQDLKDMVKTLEVNARERDKSTVSNVVKCIVDLFHNGDKQNLANLVALKEVFKSASKLCVKEMNAVVLQYQLPKHVKMLDNCSQILINETTLTSEDFKSSWLNVTGQPPDVDNVLAEPMSDYNLTWCKKVSQPVSESVRNVVDSLAQTGTENPEDLRVNAYKDIPKTITDMVKDNMQAFTDPSLTSSSDECVTNNNDVFEKADDSDNSDSTNDLPEIILLSPEEARKIFTECSEPDQKRERHQICQEERKDFKFTCPHMNDLGSDSDFFCLSCWNKTPILYIDQDETLLTPREGELNTEYQRQSHSPQSGKPIEFPSAPVCPESSIIKSVISTQKSDGSDVMRDPNPGGQTQRSSPPLARYPNPGTKNNSIIKPVAEDLQKMMCSAGSRTEHLKKVDSPSGTKILPGMTSPSRNLPCNNVKSPQTDVDGILFSRTLVIKHTCTYKQPSDHRSTSRDDAQGCNESKESGNFDLLSPKTKVGTLSQTPKGSETPKCNNALLQNQKRSIMIEQGHDGQCNETKKLRLEICGSKKSTLSCHHEKSPVYFTVSSCPNNGKSYTDQPSAKNKVYSQWNTTFIHP
ncbi:uncharacterized protein LOC131364270 [Hemibagrus wyckioides]|uniref:uncharacterized protein LOC131364270 n=1 Tax=Hemibagrus wyckioides TaxID=337641 RepID=UPI00266D4309|nr:uncharacterized protein LOC131364270 [Hemibagrus wyckioides]XP_058263350.1 uncharacterized protein LOC131364270 [Hemibagrus wyckioides]